MEIDASTDKKRSASEKIYLSKELKETSIQLDCFKLAIVNPQRNFSLQEKQIYNLKKANQGKIRPNESGDEYFFARKY